MQLEIGKPYITRDGNIVKIVKYYNDDQNSVAVIGEMEGVDVIYPTWNRNGRYRYFTQLEHKWDIVKEAEPEN